MTDTPPLPNYWEYLRLPRLLDLQAGLETDERHVSPDELHFIVVHQVFELWFKLLLNELRLAREHLARDMVPEHDIPHVVHHLGRVNEVLKQAVGHFSLVETLSPQDFLAFRDRLFGASGFQSVQMREIEILLGLEDVRRLAALGEDAGTAVGALERHASQEPGGPWVVERLSKARAELTLKGALERWLFRTPIDASTTERDDDRERVGAFTDAFLAAYERHHRETLRVLGTRGASVNVLESRLEQGLAAARTFLRAEDAAPDDDRWRLQRARAGLLFIECYRELPLLSWPRRLVDRIVELEEQLLLWRFRHARLVERIIGRRPGTGGSAGVDYLDRTTKHRIFTDLWTVRTLLLPREALPPLENAGYYEYALWR